MASFVLRRFPFQDEELETIHMPLCFVAVVDLLQVIIQLFSIPVFNKALASLGSSVQ
jgi:hypothetical protein